MFIDKNGKMTSNVGTPVIQFNTSAEYNQWKTKLPSGVKEEDFVVVLNYVPQVGSYFEIETSADLRGLPQEMKIEGVLYGVTTEHVLYSYDATNKKFNRFINDK